MAELTSPSPYAMWSARYRSAFDIAVVVVVAGWQVAGAGGQLMADRAAYRSDAVQVVAWIMVDLAVLAGSVHLLRDGRRGRADLDRTDQAARAGRGWAWSLAGVSLLIGLAAAAACPPGAMLKTDWAWGSTGWVAVLALLRRPMGELCAFLALDAGAVFAVLVKDGLHRPDLAGFLTVLAGSVTIQLAVAVAARALDSVARQAADATQSQADARERAATAGLLHSARQTRWRALQQTVGPLIRGLASGSSDPGDAEVRAQCAVEAARLRRLMAESDDSATPLLHELYASVDVAERRGVAVDIEVAGLLPVVPSGVCRAITDIVIAVLATARGHARITITAGADAVVVSLVAHITAPLRLPALAGDAGPPVVVDMQVDNGDLWVEARWTAR